MPARVAADSDALASRTNPSVTSIIRSRRGAPSGCQTRRRRQRADPLLQVAPARRRGRRVRARPPPRAVRVLASSACTAWLRRPIIMRSPPGSTPTRRVGPLLAQLPVEPRPTRRRRPGRTGPPPACASRRRAPRRPGRSARRRGRAASSGTRDRAGPVERRRHVREDPVGAAVVREVLHVGEDLLPGLHPLPHSSPNTPARHVGVPDQVVRLPHRLVLGQRAEAQEDVVGVRDAPTKVGLGDDQLPSWRCRSAPVGAIVGVTVPSGGGQALGRSHRQPAAAPDQSDLDHTPTPRAGRVPAR